MKKYLYPADILLPDFTVNDGEKWASVACDQYTSEPEYWDGFEKYTGTAPSTLKLMLPEARLSRTEEAVPQIRKCMDEYLKELLIMHGNCGIYLERTLGNGSVRRGIVACIDLEDYDFSAGSPSPVRATEKTVAERIPPRLAVRRGAPLEMPHVMLLTDDPSDSVIGRFRGRAADAYSFRLYGKGGSVRGAFIGGSEFDGINEALNALASGRKNPIVIAVGDGNHSLATAKAAWEEIKAGLSPEEQTSHPARFALTETVNIYDESLVFEPIYRVVRAENQEKLIGEFVRAAGAVSGAGEGQRFTVITAEGRVTYTVPRPEYALSVKTLQVFLDAYTAENPGTETDYIHGEDSLERLAGRPGWTGFLFDGMRKDELFPAVEKDGCLPRKTFSMGHADDKRYYIECRKIVK